MISVITWLWQQPGFPVRYKASHVNALFAMVRKHYPAPLRAICVTNFPAGIEAGIEIVPDTEDFSGVSSPHGARYPSCYRRLRMFRPDAASTFGERFVSLDIDTVITGDLRQLWDRDDEFMAWRDPNYSEQLCGSMLMLRAGSRTKVWDEFDPKTSPMIATRAGWRGSDQAWITYAAGADCQRWDQVDGVYSFKKHLIGRPLPSHARVVFFHGQHKPFDSVTQQIPWVREHYGAMREEAAA